MGTNTAPTDEEIDRFMELYEEEGTIKGVAEHEDVDWSRPTVSKWIKRRQEQEEGAEEEMEEDEDPIEESPYADDSRDSFESAEGGQDPLPSGLMEEPESPNDILLDIIDRDPKLGDDEVEYIRRFFSDYGELSPSDVTDILSDLSINNKRMTIGRINRHYEKAVNRRLREDPDLKYDERWATLLTKVTGDNHYIRQAQQHDPYGGDLGGIQPPTGDGSSTGGGAGGGGISPPANSPSTQQQTGGIQAPPRQPTQQSAQQSQMGQQPMQGQPQGGDSLSPFEERLLEMLEQQMGDDPDPQPQPQPEPQEQPSAASQLDELLSLQKKMEQLQAQTGGDSGVDEEIQSIAEQFEARMAQLEQRIAESSNEQQPVPQQSSGEDGGDSMFSEIAMLAERVDDPDMLSMLIETQTDPEVLEARAKKEEVASETKWKQSLAESLSPAAAEKAVDAFLNLTSGISQQANRRQAQAAAQQQAVQQPQPTQQPQQPQPTQQQTQSRGVEAVEEDGGQGTEAETRTSDVSSPGEQSPLREEGVEAMEADTDDADDEDDAEENTQEEGE